MERRVTGFLAEKGSPAPAPGTNGERMRHVYVAGPYTAPTAQQIQENVDRAIDAGNALLDAGLFPYVPHLSHYQHQRKQQHYEVWMALDLSVIRRMDALLRLPGASSGADREVALAKEIGIPVLWSVDECVTWARAVAEEAAWPG
jgi:hypothetical protein